jgi:hypothetical protein
MKPAEHETPDDGMLTAPRCLGCEYPLLGLDDNRCPECGRGFDLSDPATFRRPPPPVPPNRVFQETLMILGVSATLTFAKHDAGEMCYELIIDAAILFFISLYYSVTNDRHWISPILFFIGYNGIWWFDCWRESYDAGVHFFQSRLILLSFIISLIGALTLVGMKAEVHSHRKRGERDSVLEFFEGLPGNRRP